MRETFRAYYRPDATDMTELWNTGLVILDTNALLNLFRYSQRTREDFLRALVAKEDSLWIPHQVGKEFHRNRISIINKQSKAFDDIEEALSKARRQVESAFNNYKRHPSLEIGPLQAEFSDAVDLIISQLRAAQEQHVAEMLNSKTNDDILADITELYDTKVGPSFSDDQLTALYKEGAIRYESSIPPGYKDISKSEPERYGDLILWRQIIAHGAEVGKPAIFVTDDQKEDWWYTVDSDRHGARPELVEEYYAAAGQRIHFMTTDRFLDFAKAVVQDIRSESVDELEHLARERALYEADVERSAELVAAATGWSTRPARHTTGWAHAAPKAASSARGTSNSRVIAALNEQIYARSLVAEAQLALNLARQSPQDDDTGGEYEQHLGTLERELEAARSFASLADINLDRALHEDPRTSSRHDVHRTPKRIGDVVDEALGVIPLDISDEEFNDDHGWNR